MLLISLVFFILESLYSESFLQMKKRFFFSIFFFFLFWRDVKNQLPNNVEIHYKTYCHHYPQSYNNMFSLFWIQNTTAWNWWIILIVFCVIKCIEMAIFSRIYSFLITIVLPAFISRCCRSTENKKCKNRIKSFFCTGTSKIF